MSDIEASEAEGREGAALSSNGTGAESGGTEAGADTNTGTGAAGADTNTDTDTGTGTASSAVLPTAPVTAVANASAQRVFVGNMHHSVSEGGKSEAPLLMYTICVILYTVHYILYTVYYEASCRRSPLVKVWGVMCGVWGVGCGVWGVGCGV
ncbi:hypothetical protein B484DRAFT_269076 [Ochromonadaceae sp. CCMP2298]|nr:hypothetical protein B484DRAFT_269076 [Ochromonadaceae sp. CCMP2298]